MNTAAKLTAFGAAVAVTVGVGWAVGNAVGPVRDAEPAAHADQPGESGESGGHGGSGGGHSEDGGDQTVGLPGGLASSQDGYTFVPDDTTLRRGQQDFTFRILGPDGEPVTRFDVEHEKRLHLIVVRRDTEGFQHVHPELGSDGRWSVPLPLGEPGSYRAFADFKPTGGEALTLGVDLAVPGDFRPVPQQPSRVSTVDGYQVRLDGDLVAGQISPVELTVSKGGRPVTDLQPYLGAYGHLVALRQGDLAYLHVHPEESDTAGPGVHFAAEVPSSGSYRLFLDFKHGGVVRTAEFTVEV